MFWVFFVRKYSKLIKKFKIQKIDPNTKMPRIFSRNILARLGTAYFTYMYNINCWEFVSMLKNRGRALHLKSKLIITRTKVTRVVL